MEFGEIILKKSFVLALILISLCFSVFASNLNVCIYPNNAELVSYFNTYYPELTLVNNPVVCSAEDLLTGDSRLLEYVCNKSKADILIIPVIETISDFNYLRIYSYIDETKTMNKEFELLNAENTEFGFDSILSINDLFYDNSNEIENLYNQDYSLATTLVDNSLVLECRNVEADIYLNDQYLGKTPYTLNEYYAPSIIKFCADGFADYSYSLNGDNIIEIVVSLIPTFKSSIDFYKQTQNKYYASFAAAILGWGSRVLVKSLDISNPGTYKALDYASWGLAISSSLYLGYNIFNYFKNIQTTTP